MRRVKVCLVVVGACLAAPSVGAAQQRAPVQLVKLLAGVPGEMQQELLLERRCSRDLPGADAGEEPRRLVGAYRVTTIGKQRVTRQNKHGRTVRTRLIGTGSLGAEYQQSPDQSFACGGLAGSTAGTDEIGAENYEVPPRRIKKARVQLRYRVSGTRTWATVVRVMRLQRPKIRSCWIDVSPQPVATSGSNPPQSEDGVFTVAWEQWGFAGSCGMGLSARGILDPATADRSGALKADGESDAQYEVRTHGQLQYRWDLPAGFSQDSRDIDVVLSGAAARGTLTATTVSGSSATWTITLRTARECDFVLCDV